MVLQTKLIFFCRPIFVLKLMQNFFTLFVGMIDIVHAPSCCSSCLLSNPVDSFYLFDQIRIQLASLENLRTVGRFEFFIEKKLSIGLAFFLAQSQGQIVGLWDPVEGSCSDTCISDIIRETIILELQRNFENFSMFRHGDMKLNTFHSNFFCFLFELHPQQGFQQYYIYARYV